MSESQNGNMKKGVNWTGIAALVTAIGGVLGLFFVQDKNKADTEMVSESAFNVTNQRIDHMETRLIRIESILMSTASPVMSAPPECSMDADCGESLICDDGRCVEEDEVKMVPAPPIKFDKFDEIKDYVQATQEPVRFKQ